MIYRLRITFHAKFGFVNVFFSREETAVMFKIFEIIQMNADINITLKLFQVVYVLLALEVRQLTDR